MQMDKQKRVERIQGGLHIKTDCFAYKKCEGNCNALNRLFCLTENCGFYKTEFERCEECKTSRKNITCDRCIELGLK